MKPSITAQFYRVADHCQNTMASDDSNPWRYDRGSHLLHDDERLHCEVKLPFDGALLAISGSRILVIVGSLAGFGAEPANAVARFGALVARDPVAALQQMRGSFILLYVDPGHETLLFATDRAATRSPCYAVDTHCITVGLTAGDVAAARADRRTLRPQAIFDYIHSHVIPAPETIFEGVERLLPGRYLHVHRAHARVETWWTPRYSSAYKDADLPAAACEFRELLRNAVAARLDSGPIGAFLSGGTDSSTIAGMLGIVSGDAANTYSIGFDVPGFDEIRYARIASAHFRTRHHEYYLTPDDLVASTPTVAASYDQPFGNSSVIAAYYCARLAASDGMKKLLGGDGGDELFGGNTRYAKQKVFEAYTLTPRWIARDLVEPLLLGPNATKYLPLLRKARSYIEQATVPMPARMHTYNLVDHIGRDRIFEQTFLHAVDPDAPAGQHATYYARCEDPGMINRILHYDWKFTLSDNDLPKVVGACDLAGIDVAFPFLDEHIVDFANRLPIDWKVRRLRLRYFFKAALADFLPPEIIAKQKHGFGLPFGTWLVSHAGLRELATGSLESLRDRGIIRASFFDELPKRVLTEHAKFYGELVWVLMMLEQWLLAHEPGYRFGA
jgi:asparagine synthase (glutamine-hydrolysing)